MQRQLSTRLPLSQIAIHGSAKLVMMNPLAQIIQDMRYFLIDKANTPVWLLVENKFLVLIPYVLPILIFIAGFAYFNKHAKKFAEIL